MAPADGRAAEESQLPTGIGRLADLPTRLAVPVYAGGRREAGGGRREAGGGRVPAYRAPTRTATERQDAWNSVHSLLLVTRVGEEMDLGMAFVSNMFADHIPSMYRVSIFTHTHTFIYV